MVNATIYDLAGVLSALMKGFGFRFGLVFAAVFAAIFFLVWAYLSIVSVAEAATLNPHDPTSKIEFSTTTVEIRSGGKTHTFEGELALNAAQHARGLMFRRKIEQNYVMVFDFGHSRKGAMWMKNTFVPLDMLFGDEARKIVFIKENAIPRSEVLISSPIKIRYVLEVAAGTAARLQIAVGDSFTLAQ